MITIYKKLVLEVESKIEIFFENKLIEGLNKISESLKKLTNN